MIQHQTTRRHKNGNPCFELVKEHVSISTWLNLRLQNFAELSWLSPKPYRSPAAVSLRITSWRRAMSSTQTDTVCSSTPSETLSDAVHIVLYGLCPMSFIYEMTSQKTETYYSTCHFINKGRPSSRSSSPTIAHNTLLRQPAE